MHAHTHARTTRTDTLTLLHVLAQFHVSDHQTNNRVLVQVSLDVLGQGKQLRQTLQLGSLVSSPDLGSPAGDLVSGGKKNM